MPELPEVETIKEALKMSIEGATIRSVLVRNRHLRKLIPEDFEQNVQQTRITRIYRISKYVVLDLDNGHNIIIHFGMSGKIRFIKQSSLPFEKHDHVIIDTSKGILAYNDPRRFGLVTETLSEKIKDLPLFSKIGLDPFDRKLSKNYLKNKFRNKSCVIKIALLDQSIICGIGNIYASEALYEAQISPLRSCSSLSLQELEKLINSIKIILKKAIAAGGSTLHDYKRPDGSTGYFQLQHAVYGKEGKCCPHCICKKTNQHGIRKIIQDGRSTFYCPCLQK